MNQPDYWIHAIDGEDFAEGECSCKKQGATRAWNRTLFVPDSMQPIDLIKTCSFDLPIPPFFAMQPSVNKFDVECIASAMVNPRLHWHTLYQFTIGPFEHFTFGGLEPIRIGDDYDPWDYIGSPVLISGHHRFLALLLSGAPPANLQVQKAPIATSMFPWSVVVWGS